MINIITAVSSNGTIGDGNGLPWHFPSDLEFFKRMTVGKIIVMGRNTYDSIGGPLPNRLNIVLTSRNDIEPKENLKVFNNETDLHLYIDHIPLNEEVFIIGGAQIYKMFIGFADRMYLTQICKDIEGDTKFPFEMTSLDDWKFKQIDKVNENDTDLIFYELIRKFN